MLLAGVDADAPQMRERPARFQLTKESYQSCSFYFLLARWKLDDSIYFAL